MSKGQIITNREGIKLFLDALGLGDELVTSLSINGKEIVNTENISEPMEITVSKFALRTVK